MGTNRCRTAAMDSNVPDNSDSVEDPQLERSTSTKSHNTQSPTPAAKTKGPWSSWLVQTTEGHHIGVNTQPDKDRQSTTVHGATPVLESVRKPMEAAA